MNEQEYLQTFDELHNLSIENRALMTESEFLDWAESVLILAYASGVEAVASDLADSDLLDMAIDSTDIDNLEKALDFVVDGKTYKDRLSEYYNEGSDAEITRVMETEYHRMFNTGGYDTAVKQGAIYKQWITVGDDKVRDTHRYLEGIRVPIDMPFVTYDGDSAMTPGGFSLAENNVNCRCITRYSR